jgi:CDP-glucose 4,6-dehydratase
VEDVVMGFWTDRPVFVTGATGLLGSHLVAELVGLGAEVTCLVRDEVGRSHFHRLGLGARTTIVRGAVEDALLVERALNEYEIDTVFHLAAQAIVGTALRGPLSTWESNVRGTYCVLEACRRNDQRVKRVVVASSDKAYGEHDVLPYQEDAALDGRFPYDCSKACADLIARSYFETYGTPVAITRCGNLFGPGDLNWNRIVPGTIRAALRGERPIIRSDGSFVRDYIYVGDAVAGYLQLGERAGEDGVRGEAFNLSDEKPLDVRQICQAALRAAGREDLQPIVQNQASHEITRQFLDASKARARLGWAPRYGLEEGLAHTVAWYREHLAG